MAAVKGSAESSAALPLARGVPAGYAGAMELSRVASSPPEAPSAVASSLGRAKVLRGAVYRSVRKDGSVEYTNMRPRPAAMATR